MASLKCLLTSFLLLGILSAVIWKVGHKMYLPSSPPLLKDGWWAKESKESFTENKAIRKFKLSISDEVLSDLKERLNRTFLTQPLQDVNFQYGFNTNYLKEVIAYWMNKYDWREQQNSFNKFEGFKTQIEGIDIHFLHVKPKIIHKNQKVIPLLMIHGWPGSVVEFFKILPILTTSQPNQDFVFEVICPHIPGYGFSEAPHRSGFGQIEAAQVFDKLMQRLGFSHYYVQGGDWGSFIAKIMGYLFPERVDGIHLNLIAVSTNGQWFKWLVGDYLPFLVVDETEYTQLYPLKQKILDILQETGYMHIQATKPDTIGVALGDSPAGLAAYILEKFSTWTDFKFRSRPDGGLTEKFTLDELLTNVMVYWVTGSITSSMRFYKELFQTDAWEQIAKVAVDVPTGLAILPNEIQALPHSLAQHSFSKIVSYTKFPRGGHFAALEEPVLLAEDVLKFVTTVEKLKKSDLEK